MDQTRAFKIRNNMTREEYELSESAWYDNMFPRGPGDPDAYGYPGEIKEEDENEDEQIDQTEIPF